MLSYVICCWIITNVSFIHDKPFFLSCFQFVVCSFVLLNRLVSLYECFSCDVMESLVFSIVMCECLIFPYRSYESSLFVYRYEKLFYLLNFKTINTEALEARMSKLLYQECASSNYVKIIENFINSCKIHQIQAI